MLKSNPDSIFNKIGEWVDVDFETILDKKMGIVVVMSLFYLKKD